MRVRKPNQLVEGTIILLKAGASEWRMLTTLERQHSTASHATNFHFIMSPAIASRRLPRASHHTGHAARQDNKIAEGFGSVDGASAVPCRLVVSHPVHTRSECTCCR